MLHLTLSHTPGAARCEACERGKYSASEGSAACTDCAKGKYRELTGGSECQACPRGSYSTASGQSICVSCTTGKYSPTSAASSASSCLTCEANSISEAGSSNKTDCKCKQDFSGPDGGPCVGCVAGKVNPSGGKASCQVPSALPQPAAVPAGGKFVGYIDIQIQTVQGALFYTSGLSEMTVPLICSAADDFI